MRDLLRLLAYIVRVSRDIPHARIWMILVAGTGVVSGLASTAMIALVNTLVASGRTASVRQLAAFGALCIALPLTRYLSQLFLISLSQGSLLALRLRLARRVLRAPLRQLELIGAPRLLATLTSDVGTIIDSLVLLPVLLMQGSLVLSSFAYLCWLDWLLFVEVSGVIAVGVVTYQLAARRAYLHFVRTRQLLEEVFGQIRSLIEGVKELKMHTGRRSSFLDLVGDTTERLQHEAREGQKVFAGATALGQVLFFVVVGGVVLVLPQLQDVPHRALSGYAIVLFQLMSPLEVLLTAFPALSRAAVSVQKIESFGFTLRDEDATTDVVPSEPAPGLIELVDVTHTYRGEDDRSFTLGPIGLSFRPGELVFFVGGNGSGKTTLAKLLVGLYVPESGAIRLEGQEIDERNREWYRSHFSVVFSDFYLFDRLLGFEQRVIDEEARTYLALLQLEKKVRIEGNALSTLDLSQGQRKRLALLTAYLEDRPVYLFDEWAADQDPQFKEVFYRELLPSLQRRGRTVFVITHDDHYFQLADRIVKLTFGQVECDVPGSGAASERTLGVGALGQAGVHGDPLFAVESR